MTVPRPVEPSLADRIRAEADEYAKWAPTSWPSAEVMLRQAALHRAWAGEVQALQQENEQLRKELAEADSFPEPDADGHAFHGDRAGGAMPGE